MIDGFLAAVRTLTSIPVGGPDTDRRYRAVPWFLAAGVLLGSLHYLWAWTILRYVPALLPLAGLALVVVNCVTTGCLHLDGLADTADAFGNPHSREKTLEILKDPRKGSFGVAAIVVALLWRVSVYQSIVSMNGLWWFVVALGLSRILQGVMLQLLPYARGTEGKASGYRGPPWVAALLVVECAAVLAASSWRLGTNATLVATGVGMLLMLPIVLAYVRRVGGITGDCVGAASEVFELGFLAAVMV